MKNIKYIVSLISIFVIGLTAQADHHAEPEMTIAEIASGDSDFTYLVTALQVAGLDEVLNGKRQFTVFAPTNLAFENAAVALLGADATVLDLVNYLVDNDLLTYVLLYHVAPGERYSDDVGAAERVRTMAKEFIVVDDLLGTLNFDKIDVEASNGVIHTINSVLLPPM